MDKQGALYFKLLTGVFLLVLVGYGLGRLCSREPSYELYSTQVCEVGDGITVSGFVVRSESLLFCEEAPVFLIPEGQWVGGGQAFASTACGRVIAPCGGYLSYTADGYERLLTPEFILECKKEELSLLSPDTVPSRAVGRLIVEHRWYFAAGGTFPELSTGDQVLLRIGQEQWDATVLRSRELLVLECRGSIQGVLSLRQATGEVIPSTTEGIPIPKNAIYYEKGKSYVYVLRGAQARRKAVRIIRIQDHTLWIHPEDLEQGAQVILTEKEITDGMVLK